MDINNLKFHKVFDSVRGLYDSKLKPEVYQSFFWTNSNDSTLSEKQKLDGESKSNTDNCNITKSKRVSIIKDHEEQHAIRVTFEQLNAHRSVAYFMLNNAIFMEKNVPELVFSTYVFVKRALQKFTKLKWFISRKKCPRHPDLPMKSTPRQWDFFINSPIYSDFTDLLNSDIHESMKVFDECYQAAKKKFKDPKNRTTKYISININQSMKPLIADCLRNSVRLLYTKAKHKKDYKFLNVALYLSLLDQFEATPDNYMKANQ